MPESIRTDAMVENILGKLREGIPLAQICRENGMPNAETWRNWCKADGDLAIAYQRAREDGEDVIAVDALTIIDATPERIALDGGGSRIDPGSVAHNRYRAELRLKLLAKWNPKKWGEKVDVTSSDGSMTPRGLDSFYPRKDESSDDE